MQSFDAMFRLQVEPLVLVVRTLVVYAAMLAGFRLFGKRELGQVTVFDIAMILLIANAVQNAMVGPDVSLLGGLISAATLILANELVVRLRIHHRLFRRLLEGGPSVLISDGRWHRDVLNREGLDPGEVEQAMRENGVLRVDDVRVAVLEANGNISVVPKDSHTVQVPARGQLTGGGARHPPGGAPGRGHDAGSGPPGRGGGAGSGPPGRRDGGQHGAPRNGASHGHQDRPAALPPAAEDGAARSDRRR